MVRVARAETASEHGWPLAVRSAAIVVAVALAVNTGLGLTGGVERVLLVLPLAAGVGLAMGVLAIVNFEAFVLGVLVVRSSVDIGKIAARGTAALDPSSLLGVLFLIAALLWLAALRRELGPPPASPLRFALVFFLVAGLLSLIASPVRGAGLVELVRIAAAATMFFVLDRLLDSRSKISRVLLAVAASAAVPLLATVYGAVAGGGLTEQKGDYARVTATFQQSNSFSRYLMVLVIMAVGVYPHLERRWRMPAAVFIAGTTIALILTYTRSAWLGTAAGLLVVGAVHSRKMLVGLLVGGLLVVGVIPGVLSRFADLGEGRRVTGESANSLVWRLDYWGEVAPLANASPLTGIGLKGTEETTDESKPPHNDFLRAYVETGVVGLLAYLTLLVALVRTAVRALRSTDPAGEDAPDQSRRLMRGVAIGFAGCVTAFILVSAVANVISQVVFLWYFFALAAGANAVARQAETASPRAPALR